MTSAIDHARGIVRALGRPDYREAVKLVKQALAGEMRVQAKRINASSNGTWYWIRINIDSETDGAVATTEMVDAFTAGAMMGVMVAAGAETEGMPVDAFTAGTMIGVGIVTGAA